MRLAQPAASPPKRRSRSYNGEDPDVTRQNPVRPAGAWAFAAAYLAMASAGLVGVSFAHADEAYARQAVKAMSDYLAAQTAISFDYDATLEIVTTEEQKLGLASSGTVVLNRPDKIRATRTGGFADTELVFDGETLTLLGKNANRYAEADIAGSIDELVNELRDTFGRPLPAADLLLSNVDEALMPLVVDVKDLGSGVMRGVECDHLAFRTEEVDWQIWIARSDEPYPCRYVITTKDVPGAPQYTVDVSDWATGSAVAADDFTIEVPADATELDLADLPDLAELPETFGLEGLQ